MRLHACGAADADQICPCGCRTLVDISLLAYRSLSTGAIALNIDRGTYRPPGRRCVHHQLHWSSMLAVFIFITRSAWTETVGQCCAVHLTNADPGRNCLDCALRTLLFS
jgi:hypothetical protein